MGGTWDRIVNTKLGQLSRKIFLKKSLVYLKSLNAEILCLQELPIEVLVFKNAAFLSKYKVVEVRNSFVGASTTILSKLPIVNEGTVTFPQIPDNTVTRPSECPWADIQVDNGLIRIYNCRFQIRDIGIKERLQFLSIVLEHSRELARPVIVCGDMNTTVPRKGWKRRIVQIVHREPDKSMFVNGREYTRDERHIFNRKAQEYNFREIIGLDKSTWSVPYTCIKLFRLKLDWFLVRGVEPINVTIGPCITDHKPLVVNFNMNKLRTDDLA